MSTLRKVLDLLTPRERREGLLLIPLVIGMAAAEVAGIASVAPFLNLMSNPEAARTSRVLAWAYDAFGFQSDRDFLVAVGIGTIVVLVLANVFLAAGSWTLLRFGAIRNHTISRRLLIRYLQQPYAFFLTRNSATLANNVLSEVNQIVSGVVMPGLQLISKSVASLAIVTLLVVLDPLLAVLVTAVLGGAYAAIYLATRRYLKWMGNERVKANQARYRAANEAFGGIKDLRLLGREPEMVQRYATPSRRFARFRAHAGIIGILPRYALEAIAFASIVGIVLVLLAAGGSASEIVPVLGVYAFAGYRLLPALQVIFQGATQIRYSTGALEEVHRMVHLVDAHAADPDAFTDVDALEALPFRDRIRFEGVGFAYATSGPVLQDVDLEIPARTSVAFVGPTGAGKTTIVDLLLGLLEPTHGRITVDGTPLEGDAVPRWRKQMGYVPQAIYLTDDTIERNIAFGLPDARIDREAVRRAARMAQIDTFVENQLAAGYDTVVGERGVRLSGGQRQRLGIARALYHDPDVLVFDEATSSLDGSTERAVYGAIRSLAGRKTLVTIAHRLGTVRHADRIFLLDRGRISLAGTFDELLAASPLFRAMADNSEPATAAPAAGSTSEDVDAPT